MVEKEYVTWKMVEEFICRISALFEGKNISGVYGIPRGGLVLAVMLSHKMGIPLLSAPSEGCIIIDDICDSGESLLHYYNNSSRLKPTLSSYAEDDGWTPPYHIVTMYYKENKLGVLPDHYFKLKKDKWIVFPWEEV